MENLYYNLSEEEFSKSSKVLVVGLCRPVFSGGVYVLMLSFVFGHRTTIPPILSAAPFGICLMVSVIAVICHYEKKRSFFSQLIMRKLNSGTVFSSLRNIHSTGLI